jgi:hypothetical protein
MAKANSTLLPEPVAARRGLLLGALFALATPKGTTAAPSAVARVDAAAADLADALGQLHGGRWSITVDHAHGFALILAPQDGGVA